MSFLDRFFKKGIHHEKRKYLRADTGCLVKYQYRGSKGVKEPWLINAKDISEGGLMITNYEPLTPSSLLDVLINLPESPKPIAVLSKVIWCRKVSGTRCYRVGISFIELAAEDRVAITRYVKVVQKIVAHEKKHH